MSGIIIPILPQTYFDFSFLAAGGTKNLVFQAALDAVPFSSGRLLVRVHGVDFDNTLAQSMVVGVFGTDPIPGDSLEFTTSSMLMSVTVDETRSSGDLLSATSTDIYPFLKIGMAVTQDVSTSGRMWAQLSADLVLREH